MVDIVPILRFRTGLKSFTLLPVIFIRVTLISFVFFLPEIIPNGIPGSLNPALSPCGSHFPRGHPHHQSGKGEGGALTGARS